jgi:hypothetical protein
MVTGSPSVTPDGCAVQDAVGGGSYLVPCCGGGGGGGGGFDVARLCDALHPPSQNNAIVITRGLKLLFNRRNMTVPSEADSLKVTRLSAFGKLRVNTADSLVGAP